MKVVLVFLCIFACAHSVTFFSLFNQEWNNFKLEYGKKYSSAREEIKRLGLYMENSEEILKHNRLYALGLTSYKLKMNEYGDMHISEFVKTMNGLKTNSSLGFRNFKQSAPTFIPPANVEIPDHIDWRTLGAVTEVKNQGNCGSCWSFASTGALEGQHFRKTKKLVSLSEQNLIDCSIDFYNNGCEGGLMTYSYDYVKANNGIDTEKYYPYVGLDLECAYNASHSGATDHGYVEIERYDEDALKAAVATIGPISVAIDASQPSFRFYEKGIYNDLNCSDFFIDHAVLVVGYGTSKDGVDYWIVKNSWGKKWGADGYILMSRNKHNQCGIATLASYPLV